MSPQFPIYCSHPEQALVSEPEKSSLEFKGYEYTRKDRGVYADRFLTIPTTSIVGENLSYRF
jgi:hypothetical protein